MHPLGGGGGGGVEAMPVGDLCLFWVMCSSPPLAGKGTLRCAGWLPTAACNARAWRATAAALDPLLLVAILPKHATRWRRRHGAALGTRRGGGLALRTARRLICGGGAAACLLLKREPLSGAFCDHAISSRCISHLLSAGRRCKTARCRRQRRDSGLRASAFPSHLLQNVAAWRWRRRALWWLRLEGG